MVVTKQDRLSSEQAIKCWISQEDFEEDDKRKMIKRTIFITQDVSEVLLTKMQRTLQETKIHPSDTL